MTQLLSGGAQLGGALQQEQDNIQQIAMDPNELREAMRYNLDALAAVAVPDVYLAPMSTFHHSIWALVLEVIATKQRYTRHAIGIPRGHAKTHMLKLLILQMILYTDIRYILVVGNTLSLARAIIDDVMDMLGSSNIVALFGDYRFGIEKDNAEVREFRFQGREIILKPIGAGSAVRGTNINNRRPQVIICDDMQSRDEACSVEQSKNLLAWFLGTLLKARDYSRCHVLYVGNMYPDLEITPPNHFNKVYACILRNLQLDPAWISWVTGAFLADGSTIWPAVHPPEALLADLETDRRLGNAHIWYAEVQNDPNATAGMFFDADKVPGHLEPYDWPPVGKFIMIDPSLGKKTSDNQVVGYFGIYDETHVMWESMDVMQVKAPQLVMHVLQQALERRIPAIFCEAYGYQESLLHWFEFFLTQMHLPPDTIKLIPITRGGGHSAKGKNVWISQSFGSVYAGILRMRPDVLAAYVTEATAFNPLQTDNADDILDVGEYGIRVFQEHRMDCIGQWELTSAGSQRKGVDEEFDYRTMDFRDL